MSFRAEEFTFEQTDADEFVLTVLVDEAPPRGLPAPVRFFMRTEEALDLYAVVRKLLDEYVAERDAAKAEYDAGRDCYSADEVLALVRAAATEQGYDLSDPKHPTWTDRLADVADRIRKARKENTP